ncbi:hypothetical protein PTTG_25773 [Puccinia triticina 1-1 BBBD Race 1]|uniref:Uncharacterized protein n=1 Tax=Puccinia triticina (isolate 1-1 / race 1 (BBBD)) TaxID=630390 RepID=A0A180GYV9_PUCT1|nr:hypothetical protein PTTG_25773 [Puccinia triticina 1-1 BBBD Race 1]
MICLPFAFLFLWVAHPPSSLARHTLHKRMAGDGMTNQGARLLEASSRAREHPSAYDQIASTTSDLVVPLLDSGRRRPTDPSPHLPSAAPIPAMIDQFSSAWKSVSFLPKLLYFATSRPRIFSYARQLQGEFSNLPSDSDQILHLDAMIKNMLQGLINESNHKSYLRINLSYFNDQIAQQTTLHLREIRKFITEGEMQKYDTKIARNTQLIAEKLRPARPGGIHPLVDLSKKISEVNWRDLQASRKAIRSHKEPFIAALADLHGLFGPQNIFKPSLTTMLHQGSFRNWRNTLRPFSPGKLVEELQELQPRLTELAEYLYKANNAPADLSLPHNLVYELNQFQIRQAGRFGDFQAFETYMSKVIQSEHYKAFQTELESPKDIAGYELQLIQLPGDAQTLRSMVQLPGDDILAFAEDLQVREWARENTEKRLATATKAWELRENLLQFYTPQGLNLICQKITAVVKFFRQ